MSVLIEKVEYNLFYTTITWLPTMATQAGVGEANAGILASVFTLTSIPFSMIIPSLITKLSDRNRHLMLVCYHHTA